MIMITFIEISTINTAGVKPGSGLNAISSTSATET
jgi:hypothetical protein